MSPLKLTRIASGLGRPPPETSWKIAGIASAEAASRSISACTLAAVRSKCWRSRFQPPTSIAAPMTSRMLPRIEPTSEAFTPSCRLLFSANSAMMISGALPKVTLSSPPMPGPERAASSSVARPISAAVGITPPAETKKMAVAEAPRMSRTIASGMSGTRRYGQPSPLKRKERSCIRPEPRGSRGRRPGATALLEVLGAVLDLGEVVAGRAQALRVVGRGAGVARRRRGGRRAGRGRRRRRAPTARRGAQQPELLQRAAQLGQRPRVGRPADRLGLVELADRELQDHVALAQVAGLGLQLLGHVDLDVDGDLAQRVVLGAGPDVDLRRGDRARDRVLLGGRQPRRHRRAGGRRRDALGLAEQRAEVL